MARQSISALLDGEGAPAPRRAVDAHVDACPSCRRYRADATDLRRLSSLRSMRRPPEVLMATLTAPGDGPPPSSSVGATGPPPPKGGRLRRAAVLAPAVAVAVAVPIGVSAHVHIVPTRERTPCTAHLDRSRPDG